MRQVTSYDTIFCIPSRGIQMHLKDGWFLFGITQEMVFDVHPDELLLMGVRDFKFLTR